MYNKNIIKSNVIDSNENNNHNNNNGVDAALLNGETIKKQPKTATKCKTTPHLINSIILISIGMIIIIFPPYDFVMYHKLKMGFPLLQFWIEPEPIVRLSVYIFSVTNSEEFLNGNDTKLKIIEIGPIIYREHLRHVDIVFHKENSTLSYTAERELEFLTNENEAGILNKTITIPNIALLAAAASRSSSTIFTKIGFNILHQNTKDTMFRNITIYDFLWNFKSPLVSAASRIPFLDVPTNNVGVLHNIYINFNDRINVNIGEKHGLSKFFQINLINGGTTVPGFNVEDGDCNAVIVNSSEGVFYPSVLQKSTVLHYWRKTVCRTMPLYFKEEVKRGSLLGYQYELNDNAFDRESNSTSDCYKGFDDEKPLPDGLTDVSKCFYNIPFAASAPHFYLGNEQILNEKIEGLKPNRSKHYSYTIIEPNMGIPIDQCARSQSNLVMPNLYGFSRDFEKFSKMIVPMFWLEYHQRSLTTLITTLVVFVVNILPTLQYIISAICIFFGFANIAIILMQILSTRKFQLISRNDENNSKRISLHTFNKQIEILVNRSTIFKSR